MESLRHVVILKEQGLGNRDWGLDMSNSSRLIVGALLITAVAGCGRQSQVSSPAAGSAPAATPSISVTDGESLIRAMHARYMGHWYKDITFNQTTTLLAQSGQNNNQAWYVAIAGP